MMETLEHRIYFLSRCIAARDTKITDDEIEKIQELMSDISQSKSGVDTDSPSRDESDKINYEEQRKIANEANEFWNECSKADSVLGVGTAFKEFAKAVAWMAGIVNRRGLNAIFSAMMEIAEADGEIVYGENDLLMFMKGIWGLKDEMPEDMKKLIDDLENKDWRIRKKAVDALGDTNDERAIEPILTVVKDLENLNEELHSSFQEALKKLFHTLPAKNHTQAYEIAEKKYGDNEHLLSQISNVDSMLIFEWDLVFTSDIWESVIEGLDEIGRNRRIPNFGVPQSQRNFDWDKETCGLIIDVIHKTKSHGRQAGINGVKFGDTDEDGLHDSSYYGEQIQVFHETEFWIGQSWVIKTDSIESGLVPGMGVDEYGKMGSKDVMREGKLTVIIEKIIVDGQEVESCKAADKPKLISRNMAMPQNEAYINFLFLYTYIYMYDKINANVEFGWEELRDEMNEVGFNIMKELSDGNEWGLKRFHVQKYGLPIEYTIKIRNKAASEVFAIVEMCRHLKVLGFEVEDQFIQSTHILAKYFKYNTEILGEIYNLFYKMATRDGDINSSEEGILQLISEYWLLSEYNPMRINPKFL